jgi:O-antigen ligase
VLAGLVAGLSTIALVLAPPQYRVVVFAGLAVPWVAYLVDDLERLMIAAIALDAWLDIDINPRWNEALAQRGGVGGAGISITTLALGVILLIQLRRRTSERSRSAIQLSLIAYAALVSASIFVARDRSASLAVISVAIQALLSFVVFTRFMRSREQVFYVVRVVVIGIALTAFVGAADLFNGGLSSRFSGAVDTPNMLGTLLALVLPLAAAMAVSKLPHRVAARIACVGGATLLILTQSRGSWVSLAIAAVVMIAISVRRGWTEQGRRLFLFAGAISLASALPIVQDRLLGNDHGSASVRAPLMSTAEQIIRTHPLQGVGANNYAIVLPDYLTPDKAGVWVYTVHNQYLLVWAESGIFALVAFAAIIIFAIRAGLSASRSSDRDVAVLGAACAAALCGHVVHLSVDLMSARVLLLMLVIVAAIAQAAATVLPEDQQP